MKAFRVSSIVAITSVLAACGGGGGGGNPGPAAFTSFPIPASSSAVMSCDSAQGTYVANLTTGQVTPGAINPQQAGATFTVTTDTTGAPSAFKLTTASGTNLTWTSPVDTLGQLSANPNVIAAVSANGQNLVLAGNPTTQGWSYQNFGVWETGAGTGSGTYGEASFGAATPAGSVPTAGTATYNGTSIGFYVDAAGTQYYTTSNLTSNANFAARTLSFATSGTQQSTSLGLGSFSTNTILDFTGALAYSAGSNQFTGAVNNTGSTLIGTTTGRFYGPAAQEIGGTFSLGGSAGNYGGGFGAKK